MHIKLDMVKTMKLLGKFQNEITSRSFGEDQMSRKKKLTADELVKAFFYAPIDMNMTFPCFCGEKLKVNSASDRDARAECQNGHHLVLAWTFVKEEQTVFRDYRIISLPEKQTSQDKPDERIK